MHGKLQNWWVEGLNLQIMVRECLSGKVTLSERLKEPMKGAMWITRGSVAAGESARTKALRQFVVTRVSSKLKFPKFQ